ncbi:MAG: hypothetical protein WCO61_03140 [Alphaproteobacteria bacterium]
MNEAVVMKGEVSQFINDFGRMPLISDETSADYEALKAEVFKELDPKDLFETIIVHEIIAYLWSERRYRRLRDHLVKSKLIKGLAKQLEPYLPLQPQLLKKLNELGYFYRDSDRAERLVILWLTKDPKFFKDVDAVIKSLRGLVHDTVADIHGTHISEISAFEALIRDSIRSRNQGLSDFYKRRAEKKKTSATLNALGAAGSDPPLEGILR